jgi:hypothetical protein
MSTLNKWITAHRDTDVVSVDDPERALKNDSVARTAYFARRGASKRGYPVLREPKAVRLRFLEE